MFTIARPESFFSFLNVTCQRDMSRVVSPWVANTLPWSETQLFAVFLCSFHTFLVGNTTFRGVLVTLYFARKTRFVPFAQRSAGLWRGVCGSATPGRMGDMKAVMISVEDLENLITDRYAECASHARL